MWEHESIYWSGGSWSSGSWASSWGDIEVFDSTTSGGHDASDVARGRSEVEDLDYQANFERFAKAVYSTPQVISDPVPELPVASVEPLPVAIELPESDFIDTGSQEIGLDVSSKLSRHSPLKQQADNDLAILLLLAEI